MRWFDAGDRNVSSCELAESQEICRSAGGDDPTIETPAPLIALSAKLVHDEGVEQLANLPVDALLDPAVFAPAIMVSAAMVSGLAARMIEICQDHLPQRRSD